MDSESTETVLFEPKYISNIWDKNNILSTNTNGGKLKLHQKCDTPHIDYVCYNENSTTNIIIMKNMTKKFRIKMDSEEELELLSYIPSNILKFKQFSNGLYSMGKNGKKGNVLTKKGINSWVL